MDPQSIPEADIASLVEALLVQGRESHQRRMLVLAGEPDWCRQTVGNVLTRSELSRVTWVSTEESTEREVVNARSVTRLLGQERDAVVFDAHSGFDPDAFGAVSGIICGGGLFILLCPPLKEWEKIEDPASERIAISPYQYKDISGRFIQRLVKVLSDARGVSIIEQGKPMPSLDTEPAISTSVTSRDEFFEEVFRTVDQKLAVEAIEHVVHGHRRRPAVLVSDRGRGKTTALGIASARLINQAVSRTDNSKGFMHIVVTAPQRKSVEALFTQAQRLLPESERTENSLSWKDSRIQYLNPDVLCETHELADLVLVDEAAAIPASILKLLLERYSRIVFSTTVHGYEGTGRGFAIRFRQTLEEMTPGWNEVLLTQPVRWAENDPLEQLVFKALLLDAESSPDDAVAGTNIDDIIIECLDRDALVGDEQTLSQLFGLLVSAHYQTSPNDLRNLLDGPGVSVYVMRDSTKQHVLATALVSAEGDFSDDLADAIFCGQRRPRGHLIPQSLVTHVGIKSAANLRYARIMRIAVHPTLQRKGLGSQLIQFIRSRTEASGVHIFGTSFGATDDLLKFWKAQDMMPVRVGFRRDHASGEHSVMMLAPLVKNQQGAEVVKAARQRFCIDLPIWLADTLRHLDCAVVMELLRDTEYRTDITDDDFQMIEGFINGARSYEDCSAELWRFTLFVLSRHAVFPRNVENTALVAKVLQKRTWQDVIAVCAVNGRSDVISLVRSAISNLLKFQE